MKVIYDIGANNGDDIPYYLIKADLVVAVEANPGLCEQMTSRFSCEIRNDRLVVVNCVVTDTNVSGGINFYIHKSNHVLSQVAPPCPRDADCFDEVVLPALPIIDLVRKYGDPHYIKIDIEGCDAKILRSLFNEGVTPPFISAEAHSAEIFALLVSCGGYSAFKLVDGGSVAKQYARRLIFQSTTRDQVPYSFPYHSAGPYGDDIDGKWMTTENFMRRLAFEGFGWKDIHATNMVAADSLAKPSIPDFFFELLSVRQESWCAS